MAVRMQTRQDLLRVVNALMQDELKQSFHPYTMKQLLWYCNPNNTYKRYVNFKIPKKSGGERQISAPASASYMHLLRYVGTILQTLYTPSEYAMGFVPNRSIVDNAKAHIGMNYVFNIDLKDFFPSIERARMVARLQVRPFNFTKELALTVAGLCTMRVENNKDGENKYRYILPQGSPASPTITNLMCEKLDYFLSRVAKRFNLNYTRYADDITFSSMHNVYQEGSDFRIELERIITEQGFTINPKKTRLNKIGSRQEVTGLTVSRDKVNVARKYIKELRGLLFIWEKYGYCDAERRFNEYNAKNNLGKKGTFLSNVVAGKLMFLSMVKGKEDSTYLKLQSRYDKLCGLKERQPRNASVEYIKTVHVPQFEKDNNTHIILKGILEHRRAICDTKDGRIEISVQWKIDWKKYNLQQLDISYCHSKERKTSFYYLHVPFVSTRIPERVNVDDLIQELDDILSLDTDNFPDDDILRVRESENMDNLPNSLLQKDGSFSNSNDNKLENSLDESGFDDIEIQLF